MKQFIDPCCKKCTHSKSNPCERFVECCMKGPLCHDNMACALKREVIIEAVAHNPQFVVH